LAPLELKRSLVHVSAAFALKMGESVDKLVGKLFLLVVICQSGKSEGACPKMDLRVAKGMNDRGYEKIRVSVITTKETEPDCDFSDADFQYNEKFFGPAGSGIHDPQKGPLLNKMSEMTLRTTIKTVVPGGMCALDMGGEQIIVKTPAKGGRSRGLLFADPCIRQVHPGPPCKFGEQYKIKEHFSKAINALVGSDEIDFWGIIGDNFYDATGQINVEFWAELSLEAKAKPFITVPGNHDFWNAGYPEGGGGYAGVDHFGYGWMQYFGQDVVGSSLVNATPYNLPKSKSDHSWPAPAAKVPGTNPSRPVALPLSGIPLEENFVFWHQIGNVASFGYSGAHATGPNPATNHGRIDPYVEKFCKWVGESDDIVSWMLFGHWNGPNLGCMNGMDTPNVYKVLMSKSGCAKKKGLFFDGHDHCNRITAHNCAEANAKGCSDPLPVGFMIGASGMDGEVGNCQRNPDSAQGFVVVDSMAKDIAVDYYDMGKFDQLSGCWDANKDQPVTKCRSMAQKYRAVAESPQDIAARQPVRRMTPAEVPKCGSPAPPPAPPAPPGPPGPPGPGPSPGPGPGPSGPGAGLIIGGVVGGLALIAVIVALICRGKGAGAPPASGAEDGPNVSLAPATAS